jgi:hypothetical protein
VLNKTVDTSFSNVPTEASKRAPIVSLRYFLVSSVDTFVLIGGPPNETAVTISLRSLFFPVVTDYCDT